MTNYDDSMPTSNHRQFQARVIAAAQKAPSSSTAAGFLGKTLSTLLFIHSWFLLTKCIFCFFVAQLRQICQKRQSCYCMWVNDVYMLLILHSLIQSGSVCAKLHVTIYTRYTYFAVVFWVMCLCYESCNCCHGCWCVFGDDICRVYRSQFFESVLVLRITSYHIVTNDSSY